MHEFITQAIALFAGYGILGLFIMSFSESSFFPIPPDLLLIPMCFLNPEMSLWYALVTSIASVTGGLFGYWLGFMFGKPFLHWLFKSDKVDKVEALFKKHGVWAVLMAAFTPIPYKVFTIASGVFGIRRSTFVLASTAGRSARFFMEALVIMFFGQQAKYFLDNYFELTTLVISIIIILFFVLYLNRHKTAKTVRACTLCIVEFRDFLETKAAPPGDFLFGLLSGSVLAVLSVMTFAKISDEMLENEFNTIDATINHTLALVHSPFMNAFMTSFTFLGGAIGTTIILILALLVLNKNGLLKKQSLMLAISLFGAAGLNQFLKHLFSRPRPIYSLLPDVTGYSFPSGHAMVSAAFFGFMAYLFHRKIHEGPKRIAYYIAFAIFILLIGISRLYFGVHYFSDVIAGFAAGIFWAAGCAVSLRAVEYYKREGYIFKKKQKQR